MIMTDFFTPWFGEIEDVNDPKDNGRVRVRIFGYNPVDRSILPTDTLKWFITGVVQSAAQDGFGTSPTGYEKGTMVFGYYIDAERQEGVVVMALNFIKDGKNSVSPLATGVDGGGEQTKQRKSNIQKDIKTANGGTWSEPETQFAPEYPLNRVMTSRAGHVVEYDDTPGKERIVIQHKSGSFTEHHPDGDRVDRTTGTAFEILLGGKNIICVGDLNLNATGNYNVDVDGKTHIKTNGLLIESPDITMKATTVETTATALFNIDTPQTSTSKNLSAGNGATGSFTTPTGNVVDVVDGIVVNIF